MDKAELQRLHDEVFPGLCEGAWKSWRESYLAFVHRVRAASHEEWLAPAFQKELWERADVSSVGMGSSVTVATAYQDRAVAGALWRARETELPGDVAGRGKVIGAIFDEVLALVTPKHNKRRPSAKLVRALAAIFPFDVLCVLDEYKTNKLRQTLDLKKNAETFLQQHVRIRDKLREITGPAATLGEAVDQSMFAWLAYERLARTEEDEAAEGEVEPPPPPTAPEQAASVLRIPPPPQQWRGLVHVQNALELILGIVREAEQGISRQELIASILEQAPYLSALSARKQIAIARAPLGLIEEHESNLLRPTARGRQLLDGEAAGTILVPVLILRVWGVAQALHALRGAPDGLTRVDLASAVRKRNKGWKTDMAPSAIIEWCKDLGLFEVAKASGQQVVELSAYGEEWANRIPVDLSPWDLLTEPDEGDAGDEASEAVSLAAPLGLNDMIAPAFDAVMERFAADPVSALLVMPVHFLGMVHGALHASPRRRFVLLSGLSGTGKTSIAEAYARAYCAAKGVTAATHVCRVPVSPDWSDPAGLLGYVSPLGAEPTFQGTLTLDLVLRANSHPTEPFFLCLDEMNLARVEHYFAPFLSAMEGEGAQLVIHGARDKVDNIPPAIPWPRNLFILGTVNMDETTHAFSDKVLDRAFSFELWEVDLDSWRASALTRGASASVLDAIMPTLQALHVALREARRHFGYRTCDEILGFCSAVPSLVGAKQALDAAVLAKILPKVRGDDAGALPAALEQVEKACKEHGLVRSAAKVGFMRDSLRSLGVVRFSS
jgi:5-methylcytosine-specific restriction protein B